MNIIGLLKSTWKGVVGVASSQVGRMITTAAVTLAAPEALPWLTAAYKLFESSKRAVMTTEVVFSDRAAGTASAEKRQHAIDMVDADLEAYREIADATGNVFEYDKAAMAELVEKTLGYMDAVNKVKNSFNMTKKA